MVRFVHASLLLSTIAVLVMGPGARAGEWEDERPVTQDSLPQYRLVATASPEDVLYMLWPDWTVWEDTRIMLIRSENKGASWTDPATVFAGRAYDNVDLHADAAALHLLVVQFLEEEEEYKRLYYTKSTNGGQSFEDTVRVGERDNVEAISLFSGAGKVYIYAQNYDSELEQAFNYLYVSEDGGATWEEKEILPTTTVQNPGFAVSGRTIHMVFGGLLVQPEIMYSGSEDDGDTWTDPVAVSAGAGTHSQLPQITVDGEALHVAWEDDREGHFNVMYSRSTDGGLSWSADARLNDTYYGARVRLLADEEGLHAAWCQYHGASGWPSSWSSADYGIIWYKLSNDSGLSWTDEFRVSQNEHIPPISLPDQGANYVRLVEYQTGFCAAWMDKRDGNIDFYLRNNLGLSADVSPRDAAAPRFRARSLWANPAGGRLGELALHVASERNGLIHAQLIDVQGRVEFELPVRPVAAGEERVVRWSLPPVGAGIHYVRLAAMGAPASVHRLVIVR